MYNRLPSQLTEQEILDLLYSDEVEEETKQIFDYTDDVVPFLTNYNITPGTSYVSKKLIYKLYKLYSKEPLDKQTFNIQVGRYVEPAGGNFLINIDNFAISNHIYTKEKTRDKTKSLNYQKHFQWFLTERGVEKGKVWLEGFVLFFIYKDFCNSRRVSPKLGYVNFHKFLKLHLPYRRVKENRSLWFKVNEATFNIFNEEERAKIRAARTKKETRGSSEKRESEAETLKKK